MKKNSNSNIITSNEDNAEGITFVRWITRDGKRIYPPHGKKAWPLKTNKKKVQ